jgi:hypothetical protein
MASGPRLWDLATGSETSPFLDGFLPPLYLGALEADAARDLVRQHQSPSDRRPALDDDEVETICRWGAGHPFLLQLLSKRALEHGDVDRAVADVTGDRSVTSLLQVDLELLDDEQLSWLQRLSGREGVEIDGPKPTALAELIQLGLVTDDHRRGLRIALPLLERFLAQR